MPSPYRGNSYPGGCLFLPCVALGLIGQVGVLWYPGSRPIEPHPAYWLMSLIPLVALGGVGTCATARKNRARIDEITRVLRDDGLVVGTEVTPLIRENLGPHIDAIGRSIPLGRGVEGIVWFAYRDDLLIFEHRHVVGDGRYRTELVHTVVGFPDKAQEPRGAALGSAELLTLYRPRYGLVHIRRRNRAPRIRTGFRAFDRRWRIRGSEATARAFVNIDTMAVLADSPRGEIWHIGTWWVACAYPHQMDAPNLIALLEHAREVLRRVGPLPACAAPQPNVGED